MPFRKVKVRVAWALGTFWLTSIPVMLFASGKAQSGPAADANYVSALAAADRFLQAWHSGDEEQGIVLLSSHAKAAASSEAIDIFFSNPQPCGYEIRRGKALKRGRYEFPVLLICGDGSKRAVRRHFSNIVIVNTGNNDWAVDHLP